MSESLADRLWRWVKGVPRLAVEYADIGQDEANLAVRIRELLSSGATFVWVVRLTGPRRVEIHQAGQEMRIVHAGEQLEAPGILKNPVPVEALYDWRAGREVVLRNLLQHHGYDNLDAVLAEGEAKGEARGRAEGEARGKLEALRAAILDVLAARDLEVDDSLRATLDSCQDPSVLRRWHRQAVMARRAHDAIS